MASRGTGARPLETAAWSLLLIALAVVVVDAALGLVLAQAPSMPGHVSGALDEARRRWPQYMDDAAAAQRQAHAAAAALARAHPALATATPRNRYLSRRPVVEILPESEPAHAAATQALAAAQAAGVVPVGVGVVVARPGGSRRYMDVSPDELSRDEQDAVAAMELLTGVTYYPRRRLPGVVHGGGADAGGGGGGGGPAPGRAFAGAPAMAAGTMGMPTPSMAAAAAAAAAAANAQKRAHAFGGSAPGPPYRMPPTCTAAAAT